ncbi:uncharacterized protein LOC123395142 isoform X1 [Hordeum vulgare subsp. vulgare]|uniref:uncharacterized protein LOC123395142 isoform X1 n=1 Tax=Hordeum vulgare subsp. vulgare TaxID=112509 RepID=UPI001D1A4AC7|nr:uncharacterized protein LOC123395142 isoform X1 [Hordeum vulgare subsp. vulgare]
MEHVAVTGIRFYQVEGEIHWFCLLLNRCLTEYREQDALCILFSGCCALHSSLRHNFHVVCIDVLLKQRSPCLIGFPRCGFSHGTVQILPSLDEMLVNEALHQGLKIYSSWPIFPKFYIDGELFGGQLQCVTSLSVCIYFLRNYRYVYMFSAFPSPNVTV